MIEIIRFIIDIRSTLSTYLVFIESKEAYLTPRFDINKILAAIKKRCRAQMLAEQITLPLVFYPYS